MAAVATVNAERLAHILRETEPHFPQGALIKAFRYEDCLKLELRLPHCQHKVGALRTLCRENLPDTWRSYFPVSDILGEPSVEAIRMALSFIDDQLAHTDWHLKPAHTVAETLLAQGADNITAVNGLATITLSFILQVPYLHFESLTEQIRLGDVYSPEQLQKILEYAIH